MKKAIRIIFIVLAFLLIGLVSFQMTQAVYAEGTKTEQTTKPKKQVNKKLIGVAIGVGCGVALPSFIGMIFMYKKKEKVFAEQKAKLIKQLQEQKAQEVAKAENKDSLNKTTL